MKLPGTGKKKDLPVDVRRIVLAALASALEDGRGQEQAKEGRKGLTGVKALAAGAALVTAGRAAFKNRDFIRDRLQGDHDEPVDEEDYEDEDYEEDEDEEYDDEPEGEAEEDFDEEPEAEEPEAEDDEGPDPGARPSNVEKGRPPIFDRPLGRRKRTRPSTRPPKRPDGEPVLKPPPRPSRSRAPVGRT